MYRSATRLVNLGLPKASVQLYRMQVHTPYIQARCGVLFQIRLCYFSGVLPHIKTTRSKVRAYNLKDRKPGMPSHQSM